MSLSLRTRRRLQPSIDASRSCEVRTHLIRPKILGRGIQTRKTLICDYSRRFGGSKRNIYRLPEGWVQDVQTLSDTTEVEVRKF
jgi:hypothetical protein